MDAEKANLRPEFREYIEAVKLRETPAMNSMKVAEALTKKDPT